MIFFPLLKKEKTSLPLPARERQNIGPITEKMTISKPNIYLLTYNQNNN